MENKLDKKYKIILGVSILLYIGILIWIIIFKSGPYVGFFKSKDPYVINPYKYRYFTSSLYTRFLRGFELQPVEKWNAYFFGDLFLNIFLFMPYGVLFSLAFSKRPILKATIIGIITSLIFENLQLFLNIGTFDFQDICTNSIGSFFGAYFPFILYRICKNTSRDKINHFILISALILCLGVTCFSIYRYVAYYPEIKFRFDFYLSHAFN